MKLFQIKVHYPLEQAFSIILHSSHCLFFYEAVKSFIRFPVHCWVATSTQRWPVCQGDVLRRWTSQTLVDGFVVSVSEGGEAGGGRQKEEAEEEFWSWRARLGSIRTDGSSLMMVWVILFTSSCLFSWWWWCCWFSLRLCSLCCSLLSKKSCHLTPSDASNSWSQCDFWGRVWGWVSYSHVGLNGSIQNVFIWGVGGFFYFLGRRGSGKNPLEDQRHSRKHPEGNKRRRSGRKNKARTEPKTQKAAQDKPPVNRHLCSEFNPQPLRESPHNREDPPFWVWDIKQVQLRGNNGGGSGSLRVPQKQLMYNKHSHRKSKKSAPRIIPERKFQKQHSAQQEEERYGSLPPSFAFPSRPLKALQIGLSEALFQPSLHLSVNAAHTQKRPVLQNNTERAR